MLVDGEHGRLVRWDEREITFDLLVTIPLHGASRPTTCSIRRAAARRSPASSR